MRELLGWSIYGVGLLAAAYGLAEQIHQVRAERKLLLYLLRREPIANLTPPTMTELSRPDWTEDDE